jgi:hypothetical protein
MRPFVPLGMSGDRALLWLWGHYKSWTDFGDLYVMMRATLPLDALDNLERIRAPGRAHPAANVFQPQVVADF